MRHVRWLGAALTGDQTTCQTLASDFTADDWRYLNRLINEHQIAPLVWSRLRDSTLPYAPEWRQACYTAALLNERRLNALQPILDELAAWNIQPIFLKGAALLAEGYASLGERSMADIDILIPRPSIRTAWAIFSAAGFVLEPASRRYWRLMQRHTGEIRLIQRQTGAFVELHWWLYAGAWSRVAGLLTVWPQIHPACLAEREVHLPTHAEMLLHIAHHAVVSNQLGEGLGRMLADLDCVSRFEALDWTEIGSLAQQRKLGAVVWLALEIAQHWLGTPKPPLIDQLITPLRQRLLRKLAPWHILAAGIDLRQRRGWRLLLLLALQPRLRDQIALLKEGLNPVYWRR